MHQVVQAIVWTSLTAFLWIGLQSRQAPSYGPGSNLSRHLNDVLSAFRNLWVLTGISTVIAFMALLIVVLQPSQVAAWSCSPDSRAIFPAGGLITPMITVCGPVQASSGRVAVPWMIDNVEFSITPETQVEASIPSKPGQSVRADLFRTVDGQWQAMRLVAIPR